MEVPKGAKAFPSTMEKIKISSKACNQVAINKVITFHQHKEEDCRLKTLGKDKVVKAIEEKGNSPLPPPLKKKTTSSHTPPAKKFKVDVAKEKAIEDNSPRQRKLILKKIPLEKTISPSHQFVNHTPLSPRNDNPSSSPSKDNTPPIPSPKKN
uniref:Uncharacterized protein n=1 Tax=Cucumis melo TaxID=3656 RepID=A0A9I9D1F4_CUCME